MSDISASERRLIAALDRLDLAIDRGAQGLAQAQQGAPQPQTVHGASASEVETHLATARAENRRLSDDLATLHDRQAATLEAMQVRLAEAHERLTGAGEQAGRLAAANDGLAAANRALVEAGGDWSGAGEAATIAALEAEIESLRATRAAEIAQMGDILDALDNLIGTPPPPSRPARKSAQLEPPLADRTDEPSEEIAAELVIERDDDVPSSFFDDFGDGPDDADTDPKGRP